MGTGSCGVAALQLGFKFVGVELYDENIVTAERILTEGQDSFNQESLDSLVKDFNIDNDNEQVNTAA